MKTGVVLLGGVIAAGKTTLAAELVARHNFKRVSTRLFLEARAQERGLSATRSVLQQMGDELDAETDGQWVIDRIQVAMEGNPMATRFLLDSARRDFQIRRAREQWPGRVLYVHLTVPDEVARHRYDARRKENLSSDVAVTFDEAKRSPTEQHAETLQSLANLVLDMSASSAELVAGAVARSLLDFIQIEDRCA